jgi:hypothetical protein
MENISNYFPVVTAVAAPLWGAPKLWLYVVARRKRPMYLFGVFFL